MINGNAQIYAPSFFQLSDADYIPKMRQISAVTNAEMASVTTTEAHGYEVGQYVRIHISPAYGMSVSGQKSQISSVPDTTTFVCTLDTSQLFAFVTPTAPPAFTQAHVVPITGKEQNIA